MNTKRMNEIVDSNIKDIKAYGIKLSKLDLKYLKLCLKECYLYGAAYE